MKKALFLGGMGVGVAVGLLCAPRRRAMKTCVGRAMQRVSEAADCAVRKACGLF